MPQNRMKPLAAKAQIMLVQMENLQKQLHFLTKKEQHKPKFTGGCKFNKNEQYCWTHGYCVHDSESCKKKAQNYKDKATFTDIMGTQKMLFLVMTAWDCRKLFNKNLYFHSGALHAI